jgi:uncharacterized protein YecE (DUF72 family)
VSPATAPRGSGRGPKSIGSWLTRGDDVYAYFNNDAGGHAPIDARTLRRLVAA